ncbi:MAG: hypothetical protein K5681_08820 [Treponema sp.]|nr:hypothetical protein [Treponema sp.]
MIYIDTFLYYTLFSSIVLFYGLGLNQFSIIGDKSPMQIIFFFKSLLTIISTTILTYLTVSFILVPLELVEIFPIICLLIFIAFNSFAEGLIRLTTGTETTEFVLSFLIVLLAIYQSSTILDTLTICFSSICGFIILIPFIHAFRGRLKNYDEAYLKRYMCLFFFYIAILLLIISVFDISWLNGGIIK